MAKTTCHTLSLLLWKPLCVRTWGGTPFPFYLLQSTLPGIFLKLLKVLFTLPHYVQLSGYLGNCHLASTAPHPPSLLPQGMEALSGRGCAIGQRQPHYHLLNLEDSHKYSGAQITELLCLLAIFFSQTMDSWCPKWWFLWHTSLDSCSLT
jgi:hypothetical protein